MGFITGCLAGMDRRSNAAWVSPAGCSHPYSPRQRERPPPAGAAARSAAKPRIAVLRRRPHAANPRKSPAKTLPGRTARRPPSFPSVEFLPVKTEPSKGSAARPHPAPNRGSGAPRRAFLPPPNGAADPGSGASFPRYNPTRPPGRGSVWQSTWFGIRGSQVQILPPRRGPSPRRFPRRVSADGSGRRFRQTVPPDGFRQTGSARRVPPDGFRQTGFGPEAATASGRSDAFFPTPFPPRKGVVISALTHGSKRVYFGAPAGDGSSRRCPFSCSCFLTFPKRV